MCGEHLRHKDVVVVGAGIAGGAIATVLARHGVSVFVLEQQSAYRDRVRGENMMPWGVVELRRLGLEHVLLDAGAHFANKFVYYSGESGRDEAEANSFDLGKVLPDVPGFLNFGHPAATEALLTAASAAGASVRRGVGGVRISVGSTPEVVYFADGGEQRVRCRMIIGADGRASTVRRQAGIPLRRANPLHFIAGLLLEEAYEWPDQINGSGTEGEIYCLVFPQGKGRHRLYVCHSNDTARRFAGSEGPRKFLDAVCRLQSLPGERFADARIVGPCASYPGDDTWTDRPFTDGVVLVGDAGGYNDPIIGQGLSLAMRDVRIVSELMLGERHWSTDLFTPYAEERQERLRRVRFAATMSAVLNCAFGPEGDEVRRHARQRRTEAPELGLYGQAMVAGPETVPATAFDEGIRQRMLAP